MNKRQITLSLVNNTVVSVSGMLEAENVQQEEEGGQPETGIRTPTGQGGETQTGKQDEVTEVRTISKKINTFLNDKKKEKRA